MEFTLPLTLCYAHSPDINYSSETLNDKIQGLEFRLSFCLKVHCLVNERVCFKRNNIYTAAFGTPPKYCRILLIEVSILQLDLYRQKSVPVRSTTEFNRTPWGCEDLVAGSGPYSSIMPYRDTMGCTGESLEACTECLHCYTFPQGAGHSLPATRQLHLILHPF